MDVLATIANGSLRVDDFNCFVENNIMRVFVTQLSIALVACVIVSATSQRSAAGTIALEIEAGAIGTQEFGASLGIDFDVNSSIKITRLGVFDSGADGLGLDLGASVWSRDGDTGTELASLAFSTADPGELIGGSRFKNLADDLVLTPGSYTIVGYGYGVGEPNGNTAGPSAEQKTMNDGGGLITFVGGARFGDPGNPGSFPGSPDGGPENRYAAGTFEFEVVPEPAALTLLAFGALFLALFGLRRLGGNR